MLAKRVGILFVVSAAAGLGMWALDGPADAQARAQPVEPQVAKVARLTGHIEASPTAKIQGGDKVKFSVMVSNVGTAPSAAGKIRVVCLTPGGTRGDLEEDGQRYHVKFKTEERALPSLQPNQSTTITFSATHTFPGILDFVREDYMFKGYQARVRIGNQDVVIAEQPMSVAAVFSLPESTAKEKTAEVPVQGATMIQPRLPQQLQPLRRAPDAR